MGVEADMAIETKPFEILLAEDSPADAELVCEALKEHHINCSLRVVRDGAQAVTFIDSLDRDPKAPPLDLLLLDMHLPKRDGEEVLRCLRSTESYARTPVVVMTGFASSALPETGAGHAATVYFQKPSTLEEFMQLGSIVRRLLENNAATRRRQANDGGEV